MKKRLNDLERIKNLIDSDRLLGGKQFEELLLADLNNVFTEYFEKIGETAVKITKEKGGINCQITFDALSIKCFDALPKD